MEDSLKKITILYEIGLTGDGRNFFTLYRTRISGLHYNSKFIQNLSIDFNEAISKARLICGEDEDSETYSKRLISNPDEAAEIKRLGTSKENAESNGVFTYGKYKHSNISEVFDTDKKYVEWIAKGGFIKGDEDYWYSTIDEDRPIRQHAIALLIGSGDWIERQGKFMPVSKAERLD